MYEFLHEWLALIFAGFMGFAILMYVILDGYDLGVGILMSRATDPERDDMMASIGPFWDANETWLVLAIGLLLVAFPSAHGMILSALYVPTFIMLLGLILRGVSFGFRSKVKLEHKRIWDASFIIGSLITSLSQGYMLGVYVIGFKSGIAADCFGALIGVCLALGYAFIGACWLIMKAEGELQVKAVRWARIALWGTALGMAAVSIATPLLSERIFNRWFSLPNFILLMPIPLTTLGLILGTEFCLRVLPLQNDKFCWVPFAGSVGMFIMGFYGLAYSFHPYIVPERMTIWEAASAPESLMIILFGVVVIMPLLIGYTIYAYLVFWGKLKKLTYY